MRLLSRTLPLPLNPWQLAMQHQHQRRWGYHMQDSFSYAVLSVTMGTPLILDK